MPRIRVLVNPRAGRGLPASLTARLQGLAGTEVRQPAGPADVEQEAHRAREEGLERLIVVGGDGTLHHAVQGLAGGACALGIVPAGTGNDLAHALGIPLDREAALALAVDGRPRAMDLGKAGDRVFAGIAGVGLDGAVLDYLERRPGGGPSRYAFAVVRTMLSFEPPRISLELDDGLYEGPVTLVAIANSPRFGAGMLIAPDASLDDGWLDVVVVGQVSRLRMVTVFPRVYLGRHVGHPAVHVYRTRRALLRADASLTIRGDGERLLPASPEGTSIEVWPGALQVVC